MDIFSWLPIIIFIYAVSTIFGTDNKKGPNRRPPNRPQSSSRTRNPHQETKTSRPGWREMFEDLERELFPREISSPQPSRPSSSGHQTTAEGYGSEDVKEHLSNEGSWGAEGREGVEGGWSGEGTRGHEGASRYEGDLGREGRALDKAKSMPSTTSLEPKQKVSPAFPVGSENPLVQGVIWAEVLGKPRAYNKFTSKRRG